MTPSGLSERARRQDHKWQRYVEQMRLGNPPAFAEQWSEFTRIFHNRPESDGPPLAWQPAPEAAERSNLGRMIRDLGFSNFEELFHWSTRERGAFWQETIRRLGIVFERPPEGILDYRDPTEPTWLAGARLNSADSCFAADPATIAIVHGREGDEDGMTRGAGEAALQLLPPPLQEAERPLSIDYRASFPEIRPGAGPDTEESPWPSTPSCPTSGWPKPRASGRSTTARATRSRP